MVSRTTLFLLTCVHLPFAIPLCPPFTGSSRHDPQKRPTVQGSSDDDAAGIKRPPRKSVIKKKPAVEKRSVSTKKKGKQSRVNYKLMSSTDYLLVRQKYWYASPRDAALEDRLF